MAMMVVCRVVYDIRVEGYSAWGPILVAGGGTVAITLMFWLFRILDPKRHPVFPWRVPLFLALFTAGGFLYTYVSYLRAVDALERRDVRKVEGRIENFTRLTREGHGAESFSVDGVFFRYADGVVSPGYRTSRARGGDFNAGEYVKLRTKGNDILYEEICDGPEDMTR
jgi:hypothetical protein